MTKLDRLVVFASAATTSACIFIGPGPQPPPWLVVECVNVECDLTVTVDVADMMDCLGYNNGWPAAVLEDFDMVAQCDTTVPRPPDCTMVIDTAVLSMHNECGCSDEPNFDGCDCCTTPTAEEMPAAFEESADALIAALQACSLEPVVDLECDTPVDCEDRGDLTSEECGPEEQVSASGADINLVIDPLDSTVTLTQGALSDTAPLEGSGAASASPTGFMVAIAWADPLTLGSTSLTGWTFAFDNPIAFDLVSGAITVDADDDPSFTGWGLVGSSPAAYVFPLSNDAVGQMNGSNGTWYLNYSETVGNTSVVVHLEGTFTWIP